MGYLVKPNGDIKEEIKGLEIKRKNSTKFQKVEQKAFFKFLLDGHTFDEIQSYLEGWIQRLYDSPLTEVGSPRKIAKPREQYKNKAQLFRALDNTQKIRPSFNKEIGEKFYIMFVKTEDEILAFDEKNLDLLPKEIIDYPTLLEKQIFNILVPVYAGLNWGEDLLKLAEKHNVLLESAQRNTLLEEYDNYEELKKYFSANEVKKRKPGYVAKVVKPKKVKDLTKSE
jgi:DNA polymerase elongation subunit (family B)